MPRNQKNPFHFNSPQRLSFLLGAYMLVALLTFAGISLLWTYQSALHAFDKEMLTSFNQRYTITNNILTHNAELISRHIQRIAHNPELPNFILKDQRARTEQFLLDSLAAQSGPSLDILFVCDVNDAIWFDASSPLFNLTPLLPELISPKNQLERSSTILTLSKGSLKYTMLVKAEPIVHEQTGRILGTLIGGIILDDNFSLVEEIRASTQSKLVVLLNQTHVVASSDKRKARTTQSATSSLNIAAMTQDKQNGTVVQIQDGLLACLKDIIFHGKAIPLQVVIAIPDQALKELRTSFLTKGLSFFAIALIFFIITVFAIRRITYPSLNRLLQYTSTVATTEQNDQAQATTSFESGSISEFNKVGAAMETMVAKLRASQNFVQNIIDSMPSILVGVDDTGKIILWNLEAQKVTGITQAQARGKYLPKIFPYLEKSMHTVIESINAPEKQGSFRLHHLEGGITRFKELTYYPMTSNQYKGVVIRLDDITERMRIDEMMVQAEKMLSVGGLAAGMAHEINNPLGIIMASVQNTTRRLSPDFPKNMDAAKQHGIDLNKLKEYLSDRAVLYYLDSIKDAGMRAANIVKNMLEFSRKSESNFAPNNINDILDAAVNLASSDYDLKKKYDFKKITINKEYTEGLPRARVAATEIEQVLLNILKNSAHAFAEKKRSDSPPSITLRSSEEEHYLRLEVEDNGPGMDAQQKKRAFEPFYTTKGVGAGTGLGLSVSYFIITQNHQGEFSVDSTPGIGTNFIIRLPKERKY